MVRGVLVTVFVLLLGAAVDAGKLRAPARLTLTTTPRDDGTVTLTVTTTTTRAVDTLDLVLDPGDGTPIRAHFAATAAGATHALSHTTTPVAAARARAAVRTTTRGRTLMNVVAAPQPAPRLAPPRTVVDVPGVGRVAETGPP